MTENSNFIIVPGHGTKPNDVMLVGEAPGKDEARVGRPFVGRSGEEQEMYLKRWGLSAEDWYMSNVMKEYIPGNPNPTAEAIEFWSGVLEEEVKTCQPKLIIAVGGFASRWFLGKCEMATVHGVVHKGGCFDKSIEHRAQGAVVLPIYHPAAGFYKEAMRGFIAWDYEQVARVLKEVRGDGVVFRKSNLNEIYADIDQVSINSDSFGVANSLHYHLPIAIDTEGTPTKPWSIQWSHFEGEGYILRRESKWFDKTLNLLQRSIDTAPVVIFHNAMYDIEMCSVMGLDLSNATIWDPMYAAYLLRLEPQGLKALAWRWLNVKMKSYMDMVAGAGVKKQREYLKKVIELDFPKPERRLVVESDGSSKMKKPHGICQLAKSILTSVDSGRLNKDGKPTDPFKRWRTSKKDLQKKGFFEEIMEPAEEALGEMEEGTLADIPLDEAIEYSCKDADMALRLYHVLKDELEKRDLTELMENRMKVLPVFEEIQATGMPISRKKLEKLSVELDETVEGLREKISVLYYDSYPFNPNSPKQVGALLRRRGLEGMETTATGAMSTGKRSIEHLKYDDPFVADMFDCREHAHCKDAFVTTAINSIPKGVDYGNIRCTIKITRTTSTRISATGPNLLAISAHSDTGKRIRACYECKEGEVLGAWDLSQIEMRYMAHISEDKTLCRQFNEDADIHKETAATIFKIDLADVDDDLHRLPAKTTGYGIIYGQGSNGLMLELKKLGLKGWDKYKSGGLIKGWLNEYSGVRDYMERVKVGLYETGFVRDHWGMYRYLPGIWSDDDHIKADAGRKAVSHTIQGGAQGMIQNSMIWLRSRIKDLQDEGKHVWWCLQNHDELILRFDEELWETLNPLMLEGLTEHSGIELRVPVKAGGVMGRSWREAK